MTLGKTSQRFAIVCDSLWSIAPRRATASDLALAELNRSFITKLSNIICRRGNAGRREIVDFSQASVPSGPPHCCGHFGWLSTGLEQKSERFCKLRWSARLGRSGCSIRLEGRSPGRLRSGMPCRSSEAGIYRSPATAARAAEGFFQISFYPVT